MKSVILKIAALAVLVAGLAGMVRSTRAADDATPTTKPDAASPQKFYGTISAIDAAAKTFTIDDQTYTIVGETQMTKAADDSAATLADAVVGQPARGTYTKSDDGKNAVTKVRFGKRSGGKGKKKKKDATTEPATPQA